MNKTEIERLIKALNPLIPDLYEVVDEFHSHASDERDMNMQKTVNGLTEIIDFLTDQLSDPPIVWVY